MGKFIEKKLIEEFQGECFTREDLLEFYRYFDPNLKEGTFGWRIYDLKDKNIIQPLKTGFYTISNKPLFRPPMSKELMSLTKKIQLKFGYVKYGVWETDWLNEFSQHQISKSTIIVEIEKEFTQSLFFYLKSSSKQDIFLKPDEKVIEFYVAESNSPVVIKNLITRSPIERRTDQKVKPFTPLLEKILVDLFAEQKLFYYSKGPELIQIYQNSLSNYAINYTKLFGYAKQER